MTATGSPARGHDAHQHGDTDYRGRGEDEDAVTAPRSAATTRRVRQDLRAAATQIDPLQFAVGKKSKRAAIRRPERIARAFSARERLRCQLVERTHPEPRLALAGRDKRQLSAVGRQRERDQDRSSAVSESRSGLEIGSGTSRRRYSVAGTANAAAIRSENAATVQANRERRAGNCCVSATVAVSSAAPLVSSSI